MLSRVADNLYWLSRYLERAEHLARLSSVYLDSFLDQNTQVGDPRFDFFLRLVQADENAEQFDDRKKVFEWIVFDADNPDSIITAVNRARENARQIREQISSETWLEINQLYLKMKRPSKRQWNQQPQLYMQELIRDFYLIGGIIDATNSHDEGWHFLRLGSSMERAISLLHLVQIHFETYETYGNDARRHLSWTAMLKCCTAFEAYCMMYTADLTPSRIAEYLLLNGEFPHSIHFAVRTMHQALQQIAMVTKSTRNQQLNRQAGRLKSLLEFSQIDEIMDGGLPRFLQDIQAQCNQIHQSVYQVYITFPVAEELQS